MLSLCFCIMWEGGFGRYVKWSCFQDLAVHGPRGWYISRLSCLFEVHDEASVIQPVVTLIVSKYSSYSSIRGQALVYRSMCALAYLQGMQ